MINTDELEQCVLGAVLIDSDKLTAVSSILDGVGDFHSPSHQKIYESMLSLKNDDRAVDMMTVSDECGGSIGIEYLADLMEIAITSANTKVYAERLREKAGMRQVAKTASEIATKALDGSGEYLALCDSLEQTVMNIKGATEKDYSAKAVADRAIKRLNDKIAGRIKMIPTGFHDLDSKLGGMAQGELMTICARSGVGKSAIAVNIASNVTREDPEKVGIIFTY